MGNAGGKLNGATMCDGGGLCPTGIYAEDAQDYDTKVVHRLIVARQLGPFYKGADDPDPDLDPEERSDDGGWWSYNMMVAQQASQGSDEPPSGSSPADTANMGHGRKSSGILQRLRAPVQVRHERSLSDTPATQPDDAAIDACRRLLRRCIECPICFLYYPKNINYTRCCHKPICTECFVQIKRKLDDDQIVATHCPYCVEPNLGIVYYAPQLPQTMPSAVPRTISETGRARSHSASTWTRNPPIVMSDDIRPHRVRELTSVVDSRRKQQLRSAENMAMVAAATRRASAQGGRRGASQLRLQSEYSAYVRAMRGAGQTDLEEFLVQEAIRQSLAESQTESRSQSEPVAPQSEPVAPQSEQASGSSADQTSQDTDCCQSEDEDAEMESHALVRGISAMEITGTVDESESVLSESESEESESEPESKESEPGLNRGFVSAVSMSGHLVSPVTAASNEHAVFERAEPSCRSADTEAPLTLTPNELDVMASVGTQRKRRVPPPPPRAGPNAGSSSRRPVSPASSQTLTPSMPTDAVFTDTQTNPFWASMSTSPRSRRRPPPPPPHRSNAQKDTDPSLIFY
ncbi:SNF1-interacting protein [Coemansia sp. RSA 2131]|nr:SNF1-interacting protein [Coemansia sp. RSA 2131]